MNKNMNTIDRRVRAVLARVAAAIGILVGPGSAGAIVLYAIAAIMLVTGAAGYCLVYSLFHLERRSRRSLPH
jgi:hypothetical protein